MGAVHFHADALLAVLLIAPLFASDRLSGDRQPDGFFSDAIGMRR